MDAKQTLETFWESSAALHRASGKVEELIRELCAKANTDYGKGVQDGISEMKDLAAKVAVMTVEDRKEAFGILSMESLFTSRTYDQIREAHHEWREKQKREKPEPPDCHNCACSVWYAREDGNITWLCIREQPEKSVRVTLPNLCCEHWVAQGEN